MLISMTRSTKKSRNGSSLFLNTLPFLVLSLAAAAVAVQPSNTPAQSPGVITLDMVRERQPSSLLDMIQTSVIDPVEDTVASLLHPSSYHRPAKDNRHLATRKLPPSTLANTIWSYVIAVGIGTPAQKFRIIFDTGSPLVWVPSRTCEDECLGAMESFNIEKSKTVYKATGNRIHADYGSGSIDGDLVRDTLTFESKQATNQSICLVTKVVADLLSGGIDGIIGFAPSRGTYDFNSKNETLLTPMETLVAQRVVAKNIFSVYFQPIHDPEEIGVVGGKLTLGGEPSKKVYEGDIHWFPQVLDGDFANYWTIAMDHLAVGNTTIQPKQKYNGIVDTGTTLIVIPPEMTIQLYKNVPNAIFNDTLNVWTVPCNSIQSLPTLSFVFGPNDATPFTLTPEQYTVPEWQSALWGAGDSGHCPTYIIGETLGDIDFIIGQKFLEHYVSIYDGDSHRVGFAHAKPGRV